MSLRRSSRLVVSSYTTAATSTSRAVRSRVADSLNEEGAPRRPAKRARKEEADAPSEDPDELSERPAGSAKPTKKPTRRRKAQTDELKPEDFPARIENLWKFGPHVSAAGGVENAVLNAAAVGANAFGLFLKSQRKWESSPLTPQSVRSFKERLALFGYSPAHVLPHGSYLVNLGNPDKEKREKSYECFLDDLKRCEQLGLHLYNFHPGSTVGQATSEESLALVAQCVNRAHRATEHVVIVLENMAGSGNVLGSRFAELGTIISQVNDKSRVGGYDIRTKEGWQETMAEFERDVGLQYLRGMHINDSKASLNSKKDRHENIGLGHLTLSTFAHVLTDPRTKNIPLILETPVFDTPGVGGAMMDVWRTEVDVLNRLTTAGDGGREEAQLEQWKSEIAAAVGKASATKDAKGRKKAADGGPVRRAKKKAKRVEHDDGVEGEEENGSCSCAELDGEDP
ncbi:AP endonuclease [Amylocystis lapponica]|nr:AP endonuclease [Amylocystis lapponica]